MDFSEVGLYSNPIKVNPNVSYLQLHCRVLFSAHKEQVNESAGRIAFNEIAKGVTIQNPLKSQFRI